MTGFVYIWRDRKHNRYYLGSHWGSPDDGYICSSNWMRDAYRRRPADFKRRIISVITTTRKALFEEEQRWLGFAKNEEIGHRYYNLRKRTDHHWSGSTEKVKTVGQKISDKKKGKPGPRHTLETKRKISEARQGIVFTDEHRQNISLGQKGRISPMKGTVMSQEAKQHLREVNQGKVLSKETRDKMASVRQGMKWYTDGVNDCRVRENEPIPKYFRPGRTKGYLTCPRNSM